MAKMNCPGCGAQAKLAAGKPYCASCGWNVDQAKRVVRRQGILVGTAAGIASTVCVVTLISAKALNTAAMVGSIAALGVATVVFVLWVWPWMKLRRVEERLGLGGLSPAMAGGGGGKTRMVISGREVWVDMPAQAMSNAAAVPAPVMGPMVGGIGEKTKKEKAGFSIGKLKGDPDAELRKFKEWSAEKDADGKGFAQKGLAEAELKRVGTLPVPRTAKLRMAVLLRKLGWALIVLAYFVAEPVIRAFHYGASWRAFLKLLGFVGVELGVAALVWVRYIKRYWDDKRLVSEGAVTLGRVTSQKMVGNQSSEITYVFEDGRGSAVTGKGQDLTRKYFEKMWVVVFYEAGNPEKNVSQAGSMYEVG